MRRLGDIVIEEFGVPRERIESAAAGQLADAAQGLSKPIGAYIGAGDPNLHYQVALALLLQAGERAKQQDVVSTDTSRFEYAQLSDIYRYERDEINRKLRMYWSIVLGLFAYSAFPLSIAHQAPTSTLLRLYAALGLIVVCFALFLGDHLIKSYGHFQKQRQRVGRSQAIIRRYWEDAGACPATVMPSRSANKHERPHPEITSLQNRLPLCYTVWCTVKFVLVVYFAAIVYEGDLDVAGQTISRIICLACASVIPVWIWCVGAMCERYHKYIKEGDKLAPDCPLPRFGTEGLRLDTNPRRWRLMIVRILYGAISLVLVGIAIVQYLPATDIAGHAWGLPTLSAGLSAALLAVRYIESEYRTEKMALVT